MKKLTAFREYLVSHPIGIDADSLLTFAEKGIVIYHHDPHDRSYSIHYDANIVLMDFTGDFTVLNFVMLEWLSDNQPDMAPDAMKFHVDILDHKRSDVSYLVSLSEDILATAEEDGHRLTSLDEPDIHKIAMPHPDVNTDLNTGENEMNSEAGGEVE